MPFWKRSSGAASEASSTPDPDPIAVFEINGVLEGLLPWREGRLSDSLNAGEALRVRVTRHGSEAPAWEELDPDRIVAVAAPPRLEPSAARMARRRRAVELDRIASAGPPTCRPAPTPIGSWGARRSAGCR